MAINSLALSKPYLDGAVSVRTFDGTDTTDEGVIYRALAAYDTDTVFPTAALDYGDPATTVTLRVTFPTERSIDRVCIEGLLLTSGLTIDVSYGDGVTMTPFDATATPVMDDLFQTVNLIFRDDAVTADVIDVTFSDMTGRLSMQGIMVGKVFWTPDYNYNYGTSQDKGAQIEVRQVEGGARGHKTSNTRSLQLSMSEQSLAKAQDLLTFVGRRIVDGYCLFEQDQTTLTEWFLCIAQAPSYTHTVAAFYSTNLTVTEINEWL